MECFSFWKCASSICPGLEKSASLSTALFLIVFTVRQLSSYFWWVTYRKTFPQNVFLSAWDHTQICGIFLSHFLVSSFFRIPPPPKKRILWNSWTEKTGCIDLAFSSSIFISKRQVILVNIVKLLRLLELSEGET